MLKSTILFFVIQISLIVPGYGQNKVLSIGDTIPNMILTNITNATYNKTSIENIKGKLILFDFGGLNCSPCVESLTKLDSIQKVFKNDLIVFWVVKNNLQEVRSFLARNKIGKKVSLPIICQDSLLAKLFPHKSIPHEVWIDKLGVVRAFTTQHYVTRAHVQELLKKGVVTWPIKDKLDYDLNENLLQVDSANVGNLKISRPILFSYLLSHIDGLRSYYHRSTDTLNKISVLHVINRSIWGLYNLTYFFRRKEDFLPSHAIIHVKNYSRIVRDKNIIIDDWTSKNTYCYEASFPSNLPEDLLSSKMVEDLNFYLQLNGKFKDSIVNCWVLKRTVRKKSASEDKDSNDYNTLKFIANMNNTFGHQPVIDESGWSNAKGNDVTIRDSQSTNINKINEELGSAGLKFHLEKRLIKVFILNDLN